MGFIDIGHLFVLVIRIEHFARQLFLGEFRLILMHAGEQSGGGTDLGDTHQESALLPSCTPADCLREMRVFTYDEYKVFGLRRAAGIQREADGVGGFLRQQGEVLAGD